MDTAQYELIRDGYQRGCVFCDPHPATLWTSTANFGVCFDVAPLVAGHLIVFSKDHHGCAGELPPEHLDELSDVRNEVRDAIRATYGSVTSYEHGRAGHCLTDGPEHRLCHHFHLHCVPGDNDVADELGPRFRRITLTDYQTITDVYPEYGNYLFLENDAGDMSYFVVDREIERHLLRTLIANREGHPERADWRAHASRELLVTGMRDLAPPVHR